MERRTKLLIGAVAVVAAVSAGAGIAVAGDADDDDATDTPITGPELQAASAAALEHTGGGEVTGTEVGDEESLYEVEVTLEDGRRVDVQLDRDFQVVGDEVDEDETED